jgi:antitoxin (DNA-binding transcriptional repressor) of toxin-antitoxin stability system
MERQIKVMSLGYSFFSKRPASHSDGTAFKGYLQSEVGTVPALRIGYSAVLCKTACGTSVSQIHWLKLDLYRPVCILVYIAKKELFMNIEVGSYEAKTKLPELLRGIQAGNRYTITLRGEAVADLVPAEGNKHSDAMAAVDEMLSFMQARQPVAGVDLKAFINEGRA